MKNKLLNDERLKAVENTTDLKESDLHERINQMVGRRLVPSYPRHLDHYLGGGGEMHIHFGWQDKRPIGAVNSLGGEIIRDYCIVLKNLPFTFQDTMVPDRRREVTPGKIDGAFLSTTTKCNEVTVLISVFQTTDDSQGDVIREVSEVKEVSKLIRLQAYDECSSLRSNTLDSGLKVFQLLGVIEHDLTIFASSENILKSDWETRTLSALFGDTSENNIIASKFKNDPIKIAFFLPSKSAQALEYISTNIIPKTTTASIK